ncbi:hypothetical protein OHA44_22515 [Streptomyces sp. NBC_00144]|uniref:hypothetical protein n=1 Tax=unclassified Streptomyces TaxID=2593676 RepID=UPI003247CE98|nr:hypothetical protein OG221_22745 [Streptomyces sp. NBC_00932]
MAKFYAESELDGALAGFRSCGPATLKECLEPGTLWQPVFQVTIMANSENGPSVLTGTRRAESNPTHPNVISTPTSMLPLEFARCYVESMTASATELKPVHLTDLRADDLRIVARFRESGQRTVVPDPSAALPYLVGDLLARKLGCESAMEAASREKPLGECRISMIGAGFSYVADRPTEDPETVEPLYEPLLMFGAILELKDPAVIPEHTSSYKDLCWTAPEDFAEGVRTKRIESFNPKFLDEADRADSDSVTVCARGLCLQTTDKVLADLATGAADGASA